MYYILMILIVILDQVSKWFIQSHYILMGKQVIIPGFFSITYVQNTGAAWSILSGRQTFLVWVSVIEIAVIAWFFFRNRKNSNRLYMTALTLILGGAFGNLIDRVCLHYVRDFLDFIIFGYDFPVFNIADSALCIGVGLLILDMWLEERRHA